MSIQQKILQGYGYTMPDQVELLWTGTEYRIDKWPTNNPPTIADIEAIVLPELPDWRSFRSALVMSSAYGRITGHNNQTLAILPVLVNVAFLLDSDASRAVEFAGLWNAIASIAEPTTEEIAQLNVIASANNVPFQLNSTGLIT